MKPTIGRIVHYHNEQEHTHPAIITKVHKAGVVDLVVFGDDTLVPGGVATLMKNEIVEREGGAGVNAWSWPERV